MHAPSEALRDLDEKEEVDLSSLLDIQVERVEGDRQRANRLILKVSGALVLLLVMVYALSASSRREVNELIQHFKEGRGDLDAEQTQIEISQAYDDMMATLGSRSTGIDRATHSLGVDPSTVKEDGMDAEMKQMMGGEGRTSGERLRLAEGLAQVAGTELARPPAAEVEPPVKDAAGEPDSQP